MSSPCFEFGVALRTGHDLLKSVKRRTRKARSLQVRRTTLFEIDKSNNLFSERDAKLLLHPDARVAKALLASLGPKSSSLQSVRCAAYPHEIVHDDGTTNGSTGDAGRELWPPVREGSAARSPVPHLSKTDTRGRRRFAAADWGVVRRISLEWFRHRTGGTKKWPP